MAPRVARAADKRRRLKAAAAQVLHERGVERTTLADIARVAEVPVGNVYYYFKTKDELVQAALSEHRSRRTRRVVLACRSLPVRTRFGLVPATQRYQPA